MKNLAVAAAPRPGPMPYARPVSEPTWLTGPPQQMQPPPYYGHAPHQEVPQYAKTSRAPENLGYGLPEPLPGYLPGRSAAP